MISIPLPPVYDRMMEPIDFELNYHYSLDEAERLVQGVLEDHIQSPELLLSANECPALYLAKYSYDVSYLLFKTMYPSAGHGLMVPKDQIAGWALNFVRLVHDDVIDIDFAERLDSVCRNNNIWWALDDERSIKVTLLTGLGVYWAHLVV